MSGVKYSRAILALLETDPEKALQKMRDALDRNAGNLRRAAQEVGLSKRYFDLLTVKHGLRQYARDARTRARSRGEHTLRVEMAMRAQAKHGAGKALNS